MEKVIDVSNVSLEFETPVYQSNTLKEYVFNRFKGLSGKRVFQALNDVSLNVGKGDSVALLGHNGCGKSTLLRVIAGIYLPQKGKVKTTGRIAPMIELGAGFDGELSGRENIVLSCTLMGLSRSEIESRMEQIIEFSEIESFIDLPFKNFSSGMQARLGFACVTAVDPDILLVDEVLAVGDSNFARKCLARVEKLREQGTTVVLVSHDTGLVKRFCEKAFVFESGILKYEGNVDDAIRMHDDIMFERYLEGLSQKDRVDLQRRKALDEEKARTKHMILPKLSVSAVFAQGNKAVEELDVLKPFVLTVETVIDNPECLSGPVSVGIGINNHANGARFGGINNLDQNLLLPHSLFSKGKTAKLEFHFENLSFLAPFEWDLVVGVHDQDITRTLYYGTLKTVRCRAGDHSTNVSKDLIRLDPSVVRVSIGSQSSNQELAQ